MIIHTRPNYRYLLIKSGRRGWLTPVLPHHRAYRSVHGGSVEAKYAVCRSFKCRTAQHFSPTFGLSPILGQTTSFEQLLSLQCTLYLALVFNRQTLPSSSFHQFLRYYGLG